MAWPPTIGGTGVTLTTPVIDAWIAALSTNGGLTNANNFAYANISINETSGVTGAAIAVQIVSPTLTGGATVTTATGLSIAAQKVTGVTNGIGIAQLGALDVNTFAGPTTFSAAVTFSGGSILGNLTLGGNVTVSGSLTLNGGVFEVGAIAANAAGVTLNPTVSSTGSNANVGVVISTNETSRSGGGSYIAALVSANMAGSFVEPSATALLIFAPGLSAGATATQVTGIAINAQTVAGVTTGYGIFQSGSADLNFFAGKVGIGTTAPLTTGTGKLHHSGDTARIVDTANAPANSSAAGFDGEVRMSGSNFYFHIGGSWLKLTGVTF